LKAVDDGERIFLALHLPALSSVIEPVGVDRGRAAPSDLKTSSNIWLAGMRSFIPLRSVTVRSDAWSS